MQETNRAVDAQVLATADKKVALVIANVKVSEIKPILVYVQETNRAVDAQVLATADKKVALVIANVKVSEIKPILDFIKNMRILKGA